MESTNVQFREACRATARYFGKLFSARTLVALLFTLISIAAGAAEVPKMGDKAPDFELTTLDGHSIKLSQQQGKDGLVLVILRGFPGYQCPYCQKQVHDFVAHAAEFAAKNVNVVLVYPGPSAMLDQHAKEFLAKEANLPANITLVIDPDYKVTNLYSLRWDAPNETAYPSTFVLNKSGEIVFEKVSHSHGDRVMAQEALEHLPMAMMMMMMMKK